MGAQAARDLERTREPLLAGLGSARRHSGFGSVTSTQATILRLQRSVGNRAVADLLALQRCGAAPCGCEHEEPEPQAMPSSAISAQREEATDPLSAGGADDSAATKQPILGADPEVRYDGLDALQDQDGVQPDQGAPLQRDGADAGVDAPVRQGTTCRVFTSFAEFFLGTAPNSAFAAQTSFDFVVRGGQIAVEEDRAASWVNRRLVPVDGHRTPQTAAAVSGCRTAKRRPDAGDYTWSPSAGCPASAALRQPATATSAGECETVIGTQLDAEDLADMARLLRHEQYHLNLGCAVAALGNNLIAQGTAVADARNQVVAASRRLQAAYDSDTSHGCEPSAQATWEANIDSRSLAFP
ncbi:MAG TPA: hypothetical protein VIO62_01320 [Candidatus Dormibacteraeota bacterium]